MLFRSSLSIGGLVRDELVAAAMGIRTLTGVPNHGWRMAHEMAAAGDGFLWPAISFAADGEGISVRAASTPEHSQEKFRYLASFSRMVSAKAFETGVDAFLAQTVERLSLCGTGLDLRELWQEVLNERSDRELARYRQIEAMSGHDAGEAEEEDVRAIMNLQKKAGVAATLEIAALCSHYPLASVLEVADQKGIASRFGVSSDLAVAALDGARRASAMRRSPAMEGRARADRVRAAFGLKVLTPFADKDLTSLLEIQESDLLGLDGISDSPMALLISDDSNDRVIFRRRRYVSGRRFEAARMVCDKLIRPEDQWHPITETQTARQKTQRAFAAELLAPIDGLREYLDGDYSTDAIEGAAERYDVSSHMIASQLANHGVIPRWHPSVPGLHA